MRRWIELAAQLYPAAWQRRYGAEFRALIGDVQPGWREFFNVLGGAVKMQLTSGRVYLKFGLGLAAVGAIVSLAASFAVPKRYVSTAVLRITARAGTDTEAAADPREALMRAQQDVLSRSSLSEIIQRPALDLYRGERSHLPLEDIIEQMRSKDIKLSTLPSGPALAFQVQFAYEDKQKAQAVVSALVTKLAESFGKHREITVAGNLEILDPPSYPNVPVAPNRATFAIVGLVVGLVLGLIAAVFLRQPRWTLAVGGLGLAGCIAGALLSFLVPERYISTAVIRVAGGEKDGELLRHTIEQVRSRPKLAEIILRPKLNLYQKERKSRPLEDVLAQVRDHDLRFDMHNLRSGAAIAISFEYPDQFKAQAMTQAIVGEFMEQNVAEIPGSGLPESLRRTNAVELLDNASLPMSPSAPNRIVISGLGLAAGMTIGLIAMWTLRRRPQALY
jgi:capsular polysaccharide biosynthesis protein